MTGICSRLCWMLRHPLSRLSSVGFTRVSYPGERLVVGAGGCLGMQRVLRCSTALSSCCSLTRLPPPLGCALGKSATHTRTASLSLSSSPLSLGQRVFSPVLCPSSSSFLPECVELSFSRCVQQRLRTGVGLSSHRFRRDYPLNLSISVSGGKETNRDSPSRGDRKGKSSAHNLPGR